MSEFAGEPTADTNPTRERLNLAALLRCWDRGMAVGEPTADTNPTRERLNMAAFLRCWAWLVKQGHVDESDDAFDFAKEWLRRLGWPVPTASLLLDIDKVYADLRFASTQQAHKQAREAQR